MELEGVTAAVTGGASGLGAATAAALAERGAKVFVLDLPGARDRVDRERATFVECDVTNEGQVEAASLITDKVGLAGVKDAFEALGNPERHTKILVEPWR